MRLTGGGTCPTRSGSTPLANDDELAAQRRDQALLALTGLVAGARIPVDVADAVRPALEAWADHWCVVGRATRASLRSAEAEQIKIREEAHSNELRAQWVTPLFAVLDAATPTALS